MIHSKLTIILLNVLDIIIECGSHINSVSQIFVCILFWYLPFFKMSQNITYRMIHHFSYLVEIKNKHVFKNQTICRKLMFSPEFRLNICRWKTKQVIKIQYNTIPFNDLSYDNDWLNLIDYFVYWFVIWLLKDNPFCVLRTFLDRCSIS